MFKNLIIVALAVAALLLGAPAWANPLAKAAYDARVREGGVDTKNANNPAEKIRKAVLNDKKGNPAQAAYNARLSEGGAYKVDKKTPNNPADKIYQAVIKAEKEQTDEATKVANKLKPNEAGLKKIESVLGKIPEAKSTKVTTETAKIIHAYQLAKGIKNLLDTSDKYKIASTEAEKQQLQASLAVLSLDLIDRAASPLGKIHSSLVSIAVEGAKNLIKLQKYRLEEYDFILAGVDTYLNSEYRSLVAALVKNYTPKNEIVAVINALEEVKKIK